MKSLHKLNELLNNKDFDLEFESQMVQSRIISTFIEVIENKGLTQKALEELTGLSQPFISALFHNRKKLNVEHIAKFQKALDIKLQPPSYLSSEKHYKEYYLEEEYSSQLKAIFKSRLKNLDYSFEFYLKQYNSDFENDIIELNKGIVHNKKDKQQYEYEYEYV